MENVTSIGSDAFWGCDNLVYISLPEGLITIGVSAFQGSGLKSVEIPSTVKSIGNNAFYWLPLEKIQFPNTEIEWGDYNSFDGDTLPTDVYFLGNKNEWENFKTSFYINLTNANIHYNEEMPDLNVSGFKDIQDDSMYYYKPVLWASCYHITYGTGNGIFSPDDACTRAEVITFLWRAAGCPEADCSIPFEDINWWDYYYKAVRWGYQNGIVFGTSDTTFSPDDKVTRAQFITFLHRFAHEPASSGTASPFRDLPADEYYTTAVLWGYQNGIVYGTDETHFSPDEFCSRAQVVTFLHRYLTQ